ncbi:lysophospholipase [Gracilibacillus boraciitolerans JCM 21714]|uniref:Lysophospholipase n=1 Tax=Gracilibacillus boraciitolerans JCM 21714 TaxID=1298598 RepID=W4VHB5_9BACI|nr:alpha/beta hydrolase [Gracilibacillus boraciitolerans]GAE92790.1 lysophospholipase [Gracilibacillus boraciitolerans JCM 21714]
MTFLNYNKRTNQHSSFDWLCTDQYVITKYKQDPLCGFIPSNQFFYDLYDGMETIQSAADSKKIPKLLPLLLLSGKDDPVGQYGQGVQKAINFYQSLELYSVNYHIYDKNRHEILNEVNKKEVFQDITNWLDGQITCNNKKQSI